MTAKYQLSRNILVPGDLVGGPGEPQSVAEWRNDGPEKAVPLVVQTNIELVSRPNAINAGSELDLPYWAYGDSAVLTFCALFELSYGVGGAERRVYLPARKGTYSIVASYARLLLRAYLVQASTQSLFAYPNPASADWIGSGSVLPGSPANAATKAYPWVQASLDNTTVPPATITGITLPPGAPTRIEIAPTTTVFPFGDPSGAVWTTLGRGGAFTDIAGIRQVSTRIVSASGLVAGSIALRLVSGAPPLPFDYQASLFFEVDL